jgi:hypothetical protein
MHLRMERTMTQSEREQPPFDACIDRSPIGDVVLSPRERRRGAIRRNVVIML